MLRRASVAALFLALVPQTVQAFDHHFHEHHHSSDGGGCGGSDSSTSSSESTTPSAPSPVPSPSSHKRVFTTSTTYSGALGGAHGADTECARQAVASGLPGSFRAWISDGTIGAYDGIADVGPWYTTGDAVAFSSKIDLRGAPRSELLDEYGDHAQSLGAWSGSDASGNATGFDCNGWTNGTTEATGTSGSAIALDPTWGGGDAPRSCATQGPLVCFEQ
jgi:hypothetical protein